MAIDLIDSRRPGRQHVDSYRTATAGLAVENFPSVTADILLASVAIGFRAMGRAMGRTRGIEGPLP